MNKVVKIMIVSFLSVILSSCSAHHLPQTTIINTAEQIQKPPPPLQPIKADEVKSIQVVLITDSPSELFQQNTTKGKAEINKVVEWINSSKPADGKIFTKNYSAMANLVLNNGEWIVLAPAYDCKDEFGELGCTKNNDEIILILDKTHNYYRLKSLQIAQWLTDGWKQDK